MSGPWTAAEATSDAVSKKMLLAHMQENCSAEFLSEHKLTGQANSVLKRVTKDAMVAAYTVSLGEGGAKKGGAPKAAFTFSPPAAGENAATGAKAATGNLFGQAPAAQSTGAFAFNFGAKAGGDDEDDEDDDEDDDFQPGKGQKNIGKMLQQRMQRLNMSAAQRRDQTMSELPPVRPAAAPACQCCTCTRAALVLWHTMSAPPPRHRHSHSHSHPAPPRATARTPLCPPLRTPSPWLRRRCAIGWCSSRSCRSRRTSCRRSSTRSSRRCSSSMRGSTRRSTESAPSWSRAKPASPQTWPHLATPAYAPWPHLPMSLARSWAAFGTAPPPPSPPPPTKTERMRVARHAARRVPAPPVLRLPGGPVGLYLARRRLRSFRWSFARERATVVSRVRAPRSVPRHACRATLARFPRAGDASSDAAGVPGFWLQALQNNVMLAEEVQKHDEPILAYLLDLKSSTQLGGGKQARAMGDGVMG